MRVSEGRTGITGADIARRMMAKHRVPVKVIYGCESRGDGGVPYMSRYRIFEWTRFGGLYLHIFHRSDHDVMHDHPWAFASLILSAGYIEATPGGQHECGRDGLHRILGEWRVSAWKLYEADPNFEERRRVRPGSVLFRPAKWIHRVELMPDTEPVTLVWRWKTCREWGFWPRGVWENWRSYFERLGC